MTESSPASPAYPLVSLSSRVGNQQGVRISLLNDGTGTKELGNYHVLVTWPTLNGKENGISGRVLNVPRYMGAWWLVLQIGSLIESVGRSGEKDLDGSEWPAPPPAGSPAMCLVEEGKTEPSMVWRAPEVVVEFVELDPSTPKGSS